MSFRVAFGNLIANICDILLVLNELENAFGPGAVHVERRCIFGVQNRVEAECAEKERVDDAVLVELRSYLLAQASPNLHQLLEQGFHRGVAQILIIFLQCATTCHCSHLLVYLEKFGIFVDDGSHHVHLAIVVRAAQFCY